MLTDRSAKGSLACQLAEGAKRADAAASGGGAKKTAPKRGKRSKKTVADADALPASIRFIERRHEDLEGVQLERWAAAREAERERRRWA